MRLNDLPLLLDRDREVASLDAVLEGLQRGEARTLLIEGRAGIGKSRLMAELRERAGHSGIRVLSARGSELEREFPFGVVRQLFEPALADPKARKALLGGAAASAEQVLDPPTGGTDQPVDASFAALHGLYWLTANLASEEPLVIAVDDLHWCDQPSLRFLAYTVKRLEGLPLLLAACLRPSEPGTDATLLGEIANDPATVLLQPGPLGAEAIGQIVQDRLGTLPDTPFQQATHKATGGNPLLLHELVKTMAAEGVPPDAGHASILRDVGPRAVTRTVLTRLARLGPDAAPVARAVAVLGEGADLRSVASLADIPEQRTAEAMGALARSEILRPEQPLGFVHPLLREAIYRELPPGELELAHARAAELLREAGAPPEKVAAHLLVVPHRGDPEVVELLQAAARKATRQGARGQRRGLPAPCSGGATGGRAAARAPAGAGRLRDPRERARRAGPDARGPRDADRPGGARGGRGGPGPDAGVRRRPRRDRRGGRAHPARGARGHGRRPRHAGGAGPGGPPLRREGRGHGRAGRARPGQGAGRQPRRAHARRRGGLGVDLPGRHRAGVRRAGPGRPGRRVAGHQRPRLLHPRGLRHADQRRPARAARTLGAHPGRGAPARIPVRHGRA